MKYIFFVFSIFLYTLVSSESMASILGFGGNEKYPILRADVAGSEALVEIKVKEYHGYSAFLELMFDPKNTEESDRVEMIAHSFNPKKINGEDHERNFIKLRLEVFNADNGNKVEVYKKYISQEINNGSSGDNYLLLIDKFPLNPGNYVVKIKTLEANPTLSGITIQFHVGYRWK